MNLQTGMKSSYVAIIGILFSLILLLVRAINIENGDTNAIAMYMLVFFIPATILALLNTYFLHLTNKFTNSYLKIAFSLMPIVILGLIGYKTNLSIPFFDGNFSFLATISVFAIGITNLIWIISLLTKVSKNK